ncbi:MAG: hypothetical protein ACYDG3_04890 [Bacillati bacterium]
MHLVIEDADAGPEWMFACAAHRSRAVRLLVDRIAEALASRPRAIGPTIGTLYAEAIVKLATLPPQMQAYLRQRARRSPFGLEELAEESPLYMAQLAQFVRSIPQLSESTFWPDRAIRG